MPALKRKSASKNKTNFKAPRSSQSSVRSPSPPPPLEPPQCDIETDDNVFITIMTECGITLQKNGNTCATETAAVQQKLNKIFARKDDSFLETFMQYLETYTDDNEAFVSLLLPTTVEQSPESFSQADNQLQDSVIKLLLQCDKVQPSLIDMLLKKMPLYSENETLQLKNNPLLAGNGQGGIVNIPRLILNQMRWINYFVKPNEVAKQLLETSSVMQPQITCDIISFLPDVLMNLGDHSSLAKDLCEMLNTGSGEIAHAVFDAVANMSVSDETAEEIQELALSYLSTAEPEQIYHATKFLLDTCTSVEVGKKVIMALRPHLDYPELLQSFDSEDANIKLMTKRLSNSVFSTMNSKTNIFQAWIAVIDSLTKDQWLPGDLIASILLCNVLNVQQRKLASAQLVLKFKNALISKSCLTRCFKEAAHVLEDHHKCICKIAQTLLWNNDQRLKVVASKVYILLLLHLDEGQRRDVLAVILEHIGSVTSARPLEVDSALKVLFRVARERPEYLENYFGSLCEMTEHLNCMTLQQVRLCLAVLSIMSTQVQHSNNNKNNDDASCQVEDRLSSFTSSKVNIEVIWTAARFISHTLDCDDEDELVTQVSMRLKSLNFHFRSDANLWSLLFQEICVAAIGSEGYAKLSAPTIKQIKKLANDKFALMISREASASQPPQLDMTARFEVGSSSLRTICLSRSNPSHADNNILVGLCRFVRSLACLETSAEKSMAGFRWLLDHPLLLHDERYEEQKCFNELKKPEARAVLDNLFAAINWYRELVSVFSWQRKEASGDDELSRDVMRHLSRVCLLQSRVMRLLHKSPFNYAPAPLDDSNHYPTGQKCSTIKSQLKIATGVDDDDDDDFSCVGLSSTAASKKSSASAKRKAPGKKASASAAVSSYGFYAYNEQACLIELSLNVSRLLRNPLQFGEEDSDAHLHLKELHLLLSDVSNKITHVQKRAKSTPFFGNRGVDVSKAFIKLDQVKTDDFYMRLIDLTPPMCTHLDAIVSKLSSDSQKRDEDEHDDPYAASQFSTTNRKDLLNNEVMVRCYQYICEIFVSITAWIEANDNEGTVFIKFSEAVSKHQDEATQTNAVRNLFSYVERLLQHLPSAAIASLIVKLLCNILHIIEKLKGGEKRARFRKIICKGCDTILQKDWSVTDTASASSAMLASVFSVMLETSVDPLETVEQSLKIILCGIVKGDELNPFRREEEEELVVYPCATKQNFNLVHLRCLEVVVKESAKIPTAKSVSSRANDIIDLLLRWSESVKVFDLLIKVLKVISNKNMLGPTLKLSQSFIDNFMKKGINICEMMFKSSQEDVIRVLKSVQAATRQLQHLTCHSKVTKDSALTARVPALKRSLETFVFRVKALLTLHNCHQAFWLGNLKNRNLRGEELVTQSVASSDDNSGDDGDDVLDHSESLSF